jgi:hypothetical protein
MARKIGLGEQGHVLGFASVFCCWTSRPAAHVQSDPSVLGCDLVVIEQQLRPLLGAVQNADNENDIVPNRVNDAIR